MTIAPSATTRVATALRTTALNIDPVESNIERTVHVLGIDAGGTKTVCLLADEQGRVISQGRGPGANLHAAGELEVEKVLHQVMEEAIGDRPIVPAAICLGIAGVDREDEMRTVRAIM